MCVCAFSQGRRRIACSIRALLTQKSVQSAHDLVSMSPGVRLGCLMLCEIIHYRGFELHLDPQGSGLQAGIWRHGVYFLRPAIPFFPDKSLRDQLIADAKAVVDTMLDAPQRRDH